MKDGKDWLHRHWEEREWSEKGGVIKLGDLRLFYLILPSLLVESTGECRPLMNIAYMCITGGRFGRLKGYRGYHHQIAVSDQSSPHIHTWNEKEIFKLAKNPTITLGSPQ